MNADAIGVGGKPGSARRRARIRPTIGTVMKHILLGIFAIFIRVKVVGKVGPSLKNGAIVAINHLNGADSIVVQLALKTRLFFVASAKWFRNGFNRCLMTYLCDSIPVTPGNPFANITGIRDCLAVLQTGSCIGIFPEGNFNRSGRVEQIHDGAAYLAVRSSRPVLPVVITNLRLRVQVDETSRAREALTGFLSIVENFFNPDIRLIVGEPIVPCAETAQNPASLRSEIKRINTQLHKQFDRLLSAA